jgi:hypothetical protein
MKKLPAYVNLGEPGDNGRAGDDLLPHFNLDRSIKRQVEVDARAEEDEADFLALGQLITGLNVPAQAAGDGTSDLAKKHCAACRILTRRDIDNEGAALI